MADGRRDAEYILPLRWEDDSDLDELTGYLRRLTRSIDVTVVDGSPAGIFDAHGRAWGFLRHLRPSVLGLNGKACGAVTGALAARHERLIIADDDVRYDIGSLDAVLAKLNEADLVRPQNFFRPNPWHARWDTARSLIARALGGDFGGTLAVRRSALLPGYDVDVLFENLQLERTIRARGGRVVVAPDIHVARRPPAVGRFIEQRVRQAYDDFGQPPRLLVELALLPIALTMGAGVRSRRRAPRALAILALPIAVAELGRRRAGGVRIWGPTAALWAPAWLLERSLTIWLALAMRLRGGIPYRGSRIRRAASSMRALRKDMS